MQLNIQQENIPGALRIFLTILTVTLERSFGFDVSGGSMIVMMRHNGGGYGCSNGNWDILRLWRLVGGGDDGEMTIPLAVMLSRENVKQC